MLKKYIKLYLISLFVGLSLLTLVFSIPVSKLQPNVFNHVWNDTYIPSVIPYYRNTQLATWTDHLMLAIATTDDTEHNAFQKALYSPQPFYENNVVPETILKDMASGREDLIVGTYGRYWHGYLVYLKPMLLFMNYFDIQSFNSFLSLIVLFLVILYMYKNDDLKKYAFRFFLAYIFICPSIIGISLQYSSVYYISLLGSFLVIKNKNRQNDFLLFSFLGMFTCYMDFLTYPTITLTIPLVIYTLKHKETKFKDIIRLAFFWGFSYVLFWASKWVLTTLFTESNIITDAIKQLAFRSSNVVDGYEITRIQALQDTFSVFFKKSYLLLIILLIIGYIITHYKKQQELLNKNTYINFILIVLIPIVWIFVTANHADFHSFFTFRNLIAVIIVILCAFPYVKDSQ